MCYHNHIDGNVLVTCTIFFHFWRNNYPFCGFPCQINVITLNNIESTSNSGLQDSYIMAGRMCISSMMICTYILPSYTSRYYLHVEIRSTTRISVLDIVLHIVIELAKQFRIIISCHDMFVREVLCRT